VFAADHSRRGVIALRRRGVDVNPSIHAGFGSVVEIGGMLDMDVYTSTLRCGMGVAPDVGRVPQGRGKSCTTIATAAKNSLTPRLRGASVPPDDM
jgi:hypothetical protein